jgi:hypothetical protein
MATAQEVSNRAALVKSQIEQCLLRCQNAPYSSFERMRRIQEVQEEANTISERIANEIRQIEGPARETFENVRHQLSEKQLALDELQRKQRELSLERKAAQNELSAKLTAAATEDNSSVELERTWKSLLADSEEQQAEIEHKIVVAQNELSEAHALQYKAQLDRAGDNRDGIHERHDRRV